MRCGSSAAALLATWTRSRCGATLCCLARPMPRWTKFPRPASAASAAACGLKSGTAMTAGDVGRMVTVMGPTVTVMGRIVTAMDRIVMSRMVAMRRCSFDSAWVSGYSFQRSPALLRRLGRLPGGEFSVGLRSCCSSSATDSQPNRLCPLCVPNACAGKGERLRSHWGSCSWSSAEGCHRPSIAGGSREQLKACWFVVQVRPARARATRVSSAGVA